MAVQAAAESAISCMLYSDPIYKWAPEGETDLNVLICGNDGYAVEFLDQCLQAGQMLRYHLHIIVLTDEPEQTRDRYLSSRPALCKFVAVQGIPAGQAFEPYGSLSFRRETYAGQNDQFRKADIEHILLHSASDEGNGHIHYVFISAGDDQKNIAAAGLFSAAAAELNIRCSVHYVCAAENADDNMAAGMPVVINGAADGAAFHELERMAFNTHLCWKGFHGTYIRKEQESFRDSEDRRSSLLFAASLPYKLSSLGIEAADLPEAAEALDRILQSHEQDETLYRLAALEHRRWLMEKACGGWQAPSGGKNGADYSYCLETMKPSDEKHRIHGCLVRSTSSFPLENWTEEMWDREEREPAQLDGLDRMSIELHRMYRNKADMLSSGTVQDMPCMKSIQAAIPAAASEARRCFDHFCLCVKRIIDGSKGYSNRYSYYKNNLLRAVRKEEGIPEETIQRSLDVLTKEIHPAIQRNLYVNYKREDLHLIRKIPFIMTYSQPESMIIGFQADSGTNSDMLLHCVASVTAIRPRKVVYLIRITENTSPELTTGRLESIKRYLSGQLGPVIMIVKAACICPGTEKENVLYKEIRAALSSLHNRNPGIGYKVQRCSDDDDVQRFFLNSVREQQNAVVDGSNPFFASCRRNADFLMTIGEMPYVEYDFTGRRFTSFINCTYAGYIRDESCMQSADMFALMGATIVGTEYPAYAAIYPQLKEIYLGDITAMGFKKSVRAWNILVTKIKRASASAPDSGVISFQLPDSELKDGVLFSDIVAILDALQRISVIENLSADTKRQQVSFSISGDPCPGIFKNEGTMLEIYTFFEACDCGAFDDVCSGLKFTWMHSEAENELDCVLTAGYQSLVVECKDRKGKITDFIHKIDSVALHFGLGTRKIMVLTRPKEPADIQDRRYLTDLRERAKAMNVSLLMGEDDIRNIGKRLSEFAERT